MITYLLKSIPNVKAHIRPGSILSILLGDNGKLKEETQAKLLDTIRREVKHYNGVLIPSIRQFIKRVETEVKRYSDKVARVEPEVSVFDIPEFIDVMDRTDLLSVDATVIDDDYSGIVFKYLPNLELKSDDPLIKSINSYLSLIPKVELQEVFDKVIVKGAEDFTAVRYAGMLEHTTAKDRYTALAITIALLKKNNFDFVNVRPYLITNYLTNVINVLSRAIKQDIDRLPALLENDVLVLAKGTDHIVVTKQGLSKFTKMGGTIELLFGLVYYKGSIVKTEDVLGYTKVLQETWEARYIARKAESINMTANYIREFYINIAKSELAPGRHEEFTKFIRSQPDAEVLNIKFIAEVLYADYVHRKTNARLFIDSVHKYSTELSPEAAATMAIYEIITKFFVKQLRYTVA